MGRIALPAIDIDLKQARLWLALLACVSAAGCREKPDQALEEYNGASFIAKVVGFYERQFPSVPLTNLQQAFVATGSPYPDRYHSYFRAFGKHAGFKNSFYEKYVFAPVRFTNRTVTGEVVLLNAEPFPNREGKYGRMIISKTSLFDTGWDFKWYSEEQVQEIFREAGQSIPRAVPMPPPPNLPPDYKPTYPFTTRARMLFEEIAYRYGPGRFFWLPIMFIFGFVVLALVIFLFIWFGRRGRH